MYAIVFCSVRLVGLSERATIILWSISISRSWCLSHASPHPQLNLISGGPLFAAVVSCVTCRFETPSQLIRIRTTASQAPPAIENTGCVNLWNWYLHVELLKLPVASTKQIVTYTSFISGLKPDLPNSNFPHKWRRPDDSLISFVKHLAPKLKNKNRRHIFQRLSPSFSLHNLPPFSSVSVTTRLCNAW